MYPYETIMDRNQRVLESYNYTEYSRIFNGAKNLKYSYYNEDRIVAIVRNHWKYECKPKYYTEDMVKNWGQLVPSAKEDFHKALRVIDDIHSVHRERFVGMLFNWMHQLDSYLAKNDADDYVAGINIVWIRYLKEMLDHWFGDQVPENIKAL